ncbi:MAG: hypothetical protein IME96_05140 [Proteobacteria bacterium]|nr:hypothetical protein [Pseudomonadota bacterium]
MKPACEIRYSHSASILTSIIFFFLLLLFIDFKFLGATRFSADLMAYSNSFISWVIFLIIVSSFLITIKAMISPSLIFAADTLGIKIGKGVFINRIQSIPWSSVNIITEGEIRVRSTSRGEKVSTLPAIKIIFNETIDLGDIGTEFARPESKHNFIIASTLFDSPIDTAIAELSYLKKAAT